MPLKNAEASSPHNKELSDPKCSPAGLENPAVEGLHACLNVLHLRECLAQSKLSTHISVLV